MRRHTGISSLTQQSSHAAAYIDLSHSITSAQLTSLESSLSTFQAALRHFATAHRARIQSDPLFRAHFSRMCAELSVDPLAGGGGKAWTWLGVGEWTHGLAVQVVDVCLSTRDQNGGVIEMQQLVEGVMRLRQDGQRITQDDVGRALNALKPLGCGYDTLKLSDDVTLVRSVPQALDADSLLVLHCATNTGQRHVTASHFAAYAAKQRSWPRSRADAALHKALVEEGLVWEDAQAPNEPEYWVASLVNL